MAFIDVNGPDLPNREVRCKDGRVALSYNGSECVVDNKSMGDVFHVFFYNSTVEPATNAARYVLNTAK